MEQARQEYDQVSGTVVISVSETCCSRLAHVVSLARGRALKTSFVESDPLTPGSAF
ncbi:hypothetical protein [Streptomyces sp. Tue6028]|uniref:hypothetical protein n=1 Tax=Streptomyces sp. Tue6028 TaxID=2036037 RepID=UPI0015C8ECC9|nr:hypothetical protein [Streptomyces sp. Tue6028]